MNPGWSQNFYSSYNIRQNRSHVKGAELSSTTSIIPEELEAIISTLKLGKPTWTLYKTEKGYGVKLFWKNNAG